KIVALGKNISAKLRGKDKEPTGADTRTAGQKQASVDHAIADAERMMADPKVSRADVAKALPGLKKRYQLTDVAIVDTAPGKYHVHAKVNPEKDSRDDEDNVKPQPKARVDKPIPHLFENIDPANPPAGWQFDDQVTMDDPTTGRKHMVSNITDPDGNKGRVVRAWDPSTKKFELISAFLDKLNAWIPSDPPFPGRSGTPLVTYATLRLKKLLGVGPGEIKKQKWSSIANERAVLELAKLTGAQYGARANAEIIHTHSWTYALTAMQQSHHQPVPGSQKVVGGMMDEPTGLTMVRDKVTELGEAGAEAWLRSTYGISLNTPILVLFDIECDVEVLP
ncbi:MAG TPA: hypothetical protein VF755_15060, partial [Catenuloplanes sp.]